MELRAYARAKHMVDTSKSKGDINPSPMVDLVMDNQARIFKAERGLGEHRKKD